MQSQTESLVGPSPDAFVKAVWALLSVRDREGARSAASASESQNYGHDCDPGVLHPLVAATPLPSARLPQVRRRLWSAVGRAEAEQRCCELHERAWPGPRQPQARRPRLRSRRPRALQLRY